MSPSQNSFLSKLSKFSKGQIQQAGQRYTPGLDSKAPNLKINSVSSAIENVACGACARARFQSVIDELSKAWNRAKHCSQRPELIQQQVDAVNDFLPSMIVKLRSRDAVAGEMWSEILSSLESDLFEDLKHWRTEDENLQPDYTDNRYSPEHSTIRDNMNDIDRCLDILRDEKDYIRSPAFKVLFDPKLLVIGEWGTGKTHLLCDTTQDRIGRNQATILVLAKNVQRNVVTEIFSQIAKELTVVEVFDKLEDLARETSDRVVIIIDGVNEGPRREWQSAVTSLQTLIADRPNIGLIASCRTPFESLVINQEDLEKFQIVKHSGFSDQEFDAQAAFFEYYNLPLSEVPLLNEEFSRPLTLKMICQSLQNLNSRKRAEGFSGIASGQKGMTYVLESFVNNVGKPIERKFKLKPKGCWKLLKGNNKISNKRLAGFASCIAENSRGYVRPSEADRIIAANYPELKPVQRRHLLDSLRTNGLIEEDAILYSTKSGPKFRVGYRLPYQRFSDHLIARYLLETYLDVSSPATIKSSFAGKSPLARTFRLSRWHYQEYANPGWAQALITEYPERVRTHLPPKQRELFCMLPKRSQKLEVYSNPFIEGIFWRNPEAFTKGTLTIVNQCLNSNCYTQVKMIDALVAVATKPEHPYQARVLYDFLARFPMPDRDMVWSEYLRRQDASPTIQRLLTWATDIDIVNLEQNYATGLVVLLSLVLTTVVRNERDSVTKALVLIGERFPEELFAHVVTSLGFNDPYVPERMLAAAYGTTLSLVDSESAQSFRPILGSLASILYREMFGHDALNATHHALMRDYALGIIELAQHASCVELPESADQNLVAPFPNTPSTFTSDGSPDSVVKEAIGRAIQMDFGNYTIGSLIPNRANYDEKNPDYVQVYAKIERRMFNLGYREARFKDVETEICRMSTYTQKRGKVDRYGKKYSWIAYFEMRGEREASFQLPDLHLGERTSDCGIDPSFPKRPCNWTPPIPDLFGDSSISTEAWVEGGFTPNWQPLLVVPEINGIQGEWILVEGYVRGANESLDRSLFAFLRGLILSRGNTRSFKETFLAIAYPGNNKIPHGATEFYLYAGEAGRRQNFARQLCQRNGRYCRQIETVFRDSANHLPGFRLEIPTIHFGWESYHSSCNDFSGFYLPAPSLIQRLGLASKSREINFYDSTGKPATLYREDGEEWSGNRHNLLYIRADLLKCYLTSTRQVLVWCNWGERDWLNIFEDYSMIQNSARERISHAHDHIHRSFFQWSVKDRRIV